MREKEQEDQFANLSAEEKLALKEQMRQPLRKGDKPCLSSICKAVDVSITDEVLEVSSDY